ncbi:hypothetical protein V1512DRAFT_267869 [Lipomyces arxii]|uniref:uncharacterized protein n=1 Tax=Lipomyces arxii TaxID=56418 RepID=UPI0034CF8E01
MDKIGTFNTASAFNTSTAANATRESDIRSSKRKRRVGEIQESQQDTATNEQMPEDFSAQQYLSFTGASDVLDPALANLNKDRLSHNRSNLNMPSQQQHQQNKSQKQPSSLQPQSQLLPPSQQEQQQQQQQQQPETQHQQHQNETQGQLMQGMRDISGLMLEQLAASYRENNSTSIPLNLAPMTSAVQTDRIVADVSDSATVINPLDPHGASTARRSRSGISKASRSKQIRTGTLPANAVSDTGVPGDVLVDSQIMQPLAPVVAANGGSFTDDEILTLDHFMQLYQAEHGIDDAELRRRVWANERKKDNFWDAVASALPLRTRASVYKHVRRRYHPYEQRGKWTSQEDEGLRQLVEQHGAQWKIIGRQIGRMPEDCRDRWRNYVKCGTSRGQNKWSVEEERKLVEIVNRIRFSEPGADINWTVVSERMGGIRSRIQCRYKWKKLHRGIDLQE